MDAPSDLDDDAEMVRWMALSDAEQDRELAAAIREHDEWYATLSRNQIYRLRRNNYLDLCKRWRRNIKAFGDPPMPVLVTHLKKCQATLIDIRMQYRLGTQTGGEA